MESPRISHTSVCLRLWHNIVSEINVGSCCMLDFSLSAQLSHDEVSKSQRIFPNVASKFVISQCREKCIDSLNYILKIHQPH